MGATGIADSLEVMLNKQDERREVDAQRLLELDENTCMACGAHGEDKRSLTIDCFYDLKEAIPEMIELKDGSGFYLRICKACRAEFMDYLQSWWMNQTLKRGSEMDSDGNLGPTSPDRNIPVRVNGAIKYVNEKEWHEMRRQKDMGRL